MIDDLIDKLLLVEGGYVANPADRGGLTNFGITQAVARAHGYSGDMSHLPRATAVAIYTADYWTGPHIDAVAALSPAIAAELFDTGVNCGVAPAVMMLQRALNVLQGANLKVDGTLTPGGATLTTLATYLAQRRAQGGEGVLLTLLNCFQGERYAELVERDPGQRVFLFGWIRNRVEKAA